VNRRRDVCEKHGDGGLGDLGRKLMVSIDEEGVVEEKTGRRGEE
jgi:hypothetical protein